MTFIEYFIIYSCLIGWGIYGLLIVPYFGAKIMQKTGESERFWFFILALFNLWAILVILFRPNFRKGLTKSDLRTLSFFGVGFVVGFIGIVVAFNSLDAILSKLG